MLDERTVLVVAHDSLNEHVYHDVAQFVVRVLFCIPHCWPFGSEAGQSPRPTISDRHPAFPDKPLRLPKWPPIATTVGEPTIDALLAQTIGLFPEWLRLVATSRDRRSVLDAFGDVTILRLSPDDARTVRTCRL